MLRLIFDFYIQSSLHVGLAVLALAHCTLLQLHLAVPLHFLSTVFWGTVLGYNVLKYAELVYLGNAKSAWYGIIFFCTAMAALCFAIELYQQSPEQQFLFLSAGLWVLCYPLLRRFGWFKLFYVSAAVTYITVFIPLWAGSYNTELLLQLIQRFFLLSTLLIPFEIWDSANDPLSLFTLPQRLGIPKTKILGYCLLIPFLILIAWQSNGQGASLVVALLAALTICFTAPTRSKYYTSFWVESVPIVWWVVLVLG